MKNKAQPALIVFVFLIILLVVGIFLYVKLDNGVKTPAPVSPEEPLSEFKPEPGGEIEPPVTEKFAWLRKEPYQTTFECNNVIYSFKTIREEGSYFNEIYTQEGLVGRLKALPLTLNSFLILAVPRGNCDRIYLTVARLESGKPREGIFEWVIAGDKLNELAVSKYYSNILNSSNFRAAISPEGNAIIIADEEAQDGLCNPRTLRILDLRSDTTKILLTLSQSEALNTSGFRGPDGHCADINISWIDSYTISYDVYDASVDHNRSFIEGRTLKVK